MRYLGLIDGKRGAFKVMLPDLPRCSAAGRTVDQAFRNAVAAVEAWVRDAMADGKALPRGRSLDDLRDDTGVAKALAKGAAIIIVPVLRDSGRYVKANLSMDAGMLEAIDAAAEAHGLTRSAFLTTAAREKI